MGVAGVVVAFIAGDKVLTLLFGPAYAASAKVFAIIMLAGALGYAVSAQGYAMTAARELVPQVPLLAGVAVVTTVSSWWLVPRQGLTGAAEAWLLGGVVQLIISTAIMSRMSRAASVGDFSRASPATVPTD
jgi:O-antigen/teichoic acid export membrane protein